MNAVHNFSNTFLYFLLENFFFNLYYLNIVFYAWHRLIEKIYGNNRKPLNLMRAIYAVFVLLYIGLLTVSIVITSNAC